jgi:hypothetical protein
MSAPRFSSRLLAGNRARRERYPGCGLRGQRNFRYRRRFRDDPRQRDQRQQHGARARLRGVTVSGNVFVNQQSQLQARNPLAFLRLRAGVLRSASTVGCFVSSICRCDGLPGNVCPVVP